MRFELVVSFLSTFQIFHQSASSTIALLAAQFGLSAGEVAWMSAAFPTGKFVGTLLVIPLYRRFGCSNRSCLDCNAAFLTAGCLLMLLPSSKFLLLGRFVAGIGVGIGFVCSTIAIRDHTTFADRPRAFLLAAVLFSAAALFSALLTFVRELAIGRFGFLLLLTAPSFLAVGVFALHRGNEDFLAMETTEEADVPNSRSLSIGGQPTALNNPNCRFYEINQSSAETEEHLDCALFNPRFLAFALMTLNASIGVPIILCFGSVIFHSMGVRGERAVVLSSVFPLVQMFVLVVTHNAGTRLSRRSAVLFGYAACLGAYFALLLTQSAHTLDSNLHFRASASAFWLIALAAGTAVPCNAAVCVISESFPTRASLIRGTAQSRAFFWLLSALACGTFLPMLTHGSLFTALLPGFCISLLAFIYVLFVLPEDRDLHSSPTPPLSFYGSTATSFFR
ncbi:hypothetical protein M3Y99_01584900 [Aphelenchoides fujianensis]|nr:hypothetical protein M3Y99_01584900 [Aphelenchoides fujianensis]